MLPLSACFLTLSLLPFLACSCKKGPASKLENASPPSPLPWTCPDTLLYTISDISPAVPGRPWQAPVVSGHDTGAMGKIHPGLVISMATRNETGSDTSDKEFLEPNFPWVGDLNGDDAIDFILREGIGSPKETAILVNCGGDRYWPVFHEMADEIRVADDLGSNRKWKLLKFQYWPAGSEEGHVVLKRWDGNTYATCCEYHGSQNTAPPESDCCS